MNLKSIREKDSKYPWVITIANESTGETAHKRLRLPEAVREAYTECVMAVAPLVAEEASAMRCVGFVIGSNDDGDFLDLFYSKMKGYFAHDVKVCKIPIKRVELNEEEINEHRNGSKNQREWLQKIEDCNFLRDRLEHLEEVIADNWAQLSGMEAGQQLDLFSLLPNLAEVEFVDEDGVVQQMKKMKSA